MLLWASREKEVSICLEAGLRRILLSPNAELLECPGEDMRPLLYLRWWQCAGWALIGLVTVLSLVPSPPETLSFQGGDKILHLAAYTGLTLWFGAIYLPGRRLCRIAALLVLLGLLLELAQGLTGYRSLQGPDMAANTLGVCVGWLLSRTRLSQAFVFIEEQIVGLRIGRD